MTALEHCLYIRLDLFSLLPPLLNTGEGFIQQFLSKENLSCSCPAELSLLLKVSLKLRFLESFLNPRLNFLMFPEHRVNGVGVREVPFYLPRIQDAVSSKLSHVKKFSHDFSSNQIGVQKRVEQIRKENVSTLL